MSSDWPVASALMAGRYRLVSLLETGGMAEIWRAEDELLDRPVAVKLPTGPQVVWREARMAARLSHPGIAAVHDYREAVRPDGTVVPFVVMELLTGESVAARVDRELVGWAETARIGAAVADALAAAHASGVVHRDIKPGNVMLTPNGVKILDFGISVAAGEPDDDDTGATFGTPAYVAPERLDGMPAEPATDVYGVGVLLFEMVTGDPPYPVETWEELAAARASGPSELPESLPADFRDVVNRCLDADPAKRPTAARLRADLLAVALRSRPPAPDAGEASRARVTSDRPAPEPEPHESGAVAHDDASMWPVGASGSIGNLVRAAGVSADQLGAAGSFGAAAGGNGRAGVAWSVLDPFAEDDPAAVRRTAGSPRSSFAYDDDDEARDWRPGRGRGAGTGPPDQRRPMGTRNFATGRASAATLDMDESPRRRRLFGVGAAVVLAALVGAFAVLTWTHRDSDRNAAVPPAATTPVTPTATATTPAPAATAASPTSAVPSTRTSLTFADAVSRMRDAVNGGVASGQIRKDVAQDLLNLLRPLSDAQGSDLTGQVQALRQKIQTRVGEGGVTEARAAVLQSRLEDLDRAAGI